MSETLSLEKEGINLQPRPGTLLKCMVKEYDYLNEVMDMVKKRLELERQHLANLKELRASWNPKWSDSGIWSLVSPVLNYLGDQIVHCEDEMNEIMSRLAKIPDIPSPHRKLADGFDPLEMENCLETVFNGYLRCHERVITPDSLARLRAWYLKAHEWDHMVLPEIDREYRKAVVEQQPHAAQARKWYSQELPVILEQHQQRAENIKVFFQGMLSTESKLSADMSASCALAIRATVDFSSPSFIGNHHDEAEREKSHRLLQAALYRNYMLGGRIAQPLFGLGRETTMKLIGETLDHMGQKSKPVRGEYHLALHEAFMLEEGHLDMDFHEQLKDRDETWYTSLLMTTFFVEPPLIQLDERHKKYYAGVKRAQIQAIMNELVPVARRDVLSMTLRMMDRIMIDHPQSLAHQKATSNLAHNLHGEYVFRDIWRKWDVERDCPLPEGIERIWDVTEKKSILAWKKTKEPYIPKVASSSSLNRGKEYLPKIASISSLRRGKEERSTLIEIESNAH